MTVFFKRAFLTISLILIFSFSCFAKDDFSFGCDVSDMLNYSGKILNAEQGTYYANENCYDYLFFQNGSEAELVCEKSVKCLNLIENSLYFVSQEGSSCTIYCLNIHTKKLTPVKENLPSDIMQMYVSRDKTVYYSAGNNIYRLSADTGTAHIVMEKENLVSFVPTEKGIVYAAGQPLDFSLFACDVLLCENADSYTVNFESSSIFYSKKGTDYQLSLFSAFKGKTAAEEFTGLGSVDINDLFSEDMTYNERIQDDAYIDSISTYSLKRVVKNRKELSQGVKNMIKRAEQLNSINWTPRKDIYGWNKEYVYKAGQTYSGLPYGQPVFAKYVPWSASFADFLKAVDDTSSYMYTKYSYNGEIAPYYSIDCSAYISWVWGLSERHTTVGIPYKATLVSKSSFADAKVGDIICKSGVHVVLISDITYDEKGAVNSITVSESAPKKDTDLCCQTTSYGSGHELSLADLTQKYFYDGYYLYRNPEASSVSYTHYCEVILDGDSCTKCKSGETDYLRPFNTTVKVTAASVNAYDKASERSYIRAKYKNSRSITIVGYAKNSSGEVWYKTNNGYWVNGKSLSYTKLNSTVSISELSLPSGEIDFACDPPLKGTVNCSNLIESIKVEVFSRSDLYFKPVLSSDTGKTADGYSLEGSKHDSSIDFSTLTPGKYRITLTVTEYSYSPFIKQKVTREKKFHSYFTISDDPRCTSWSTKYPELVDEQFIEKETRHSYSDLVTVVNSKPSMNGYTLKSKRWITDDKGTVEGVSSWPEGFEKTNSLYVKYDISSLKASQSDTQKTTVSKGKTVGYIYYHWCDASLTNGPSNRLINKTETSVYKAFHAFYSTKKPSELTAVGSCYKYSNSSCCKNSYWYYALAVNSASYHKQSMEYTHTRWTPWSSWSDTKYESSDTRRTKTALVYRYNDKIHSWDEGVVQSASTCSTNGISVHTCSHCDMVKNQPLPTAPHSYEKTYTIDTAATIKNNGSESRHCENCSAVTDKTVIPSISKFVTSFKKAVYNGERQRPYLSVYDEKGTRLTYKTDYTVKYSSGSTEVGKYTLAVTFKGKYAGTKELDYYIIPPATKKLKATQSNNSITLYWKKVSGATGYRVFVYNSSTKKYKALKTTALDTYTHTGLISCKAYTYVVKAYKKVGKDYYWSTAAKISTATKPDTPTVTVKSTAKGSAYVTWTKCAGVSGYQIFMFDKDTGKYKKLSNSIVRRYTLKNLTSGKNQHIKIRAYRKVGNGYVYGSFSKAEVVKIK